MHILKMALFLGSGLSLFACGSSSSSSSGLPTDVLNIGATDSVSANGLPFATVGSTLADAEGVDADIRLVRVVSDNETDETTIQITSETVTLTGFDGTLEGTLTYNGETVTLVGGQATLANGQTLASNKNSTGNYSTTFAVSSYAYPGGTGPGVNMHGVFAIGLETDPAAIAAVAGTMQYSGPLRGYGTLLDGAGDLVANEVSIVGTAVLEVEFDDNDTVTGIMYFDVSDGVIDYLDVDLRLESTSVVGNGFGTSVNAIRNCPISSSCASDSRIGGALFGPNADEINGLAAIDYTETFANGESSRVVGTASFRAD